MGLRCWTVTYKRVFGVAVCVCLPAIILLSLSQSLPEPPKPTQCPLYTIQDTSQVTVTFLNDQWQVSQGPSSRFMVRSAFLDSRATEKVVRVFGISSALPGNSHVTCQFWNAYGRKGETLPARVKEYGRGAKVDGVRFQEILFSCPVSPGPIPHSVSLVPHPCLTTTHVTTLLRIQVSKPAPQKKIDIGVCVPVLYGRVSVPWLVEWIELNRILGVGEFNFYLSRPNKAAVSALQYYSELGVVRTQDVTPPVPVRDNDWCYWCQKLAVIPTLNDCLYRNMHRYNFILSIDIDEFIVPRHASSDLKDMLRTLDPDRERSGYQFRNAYFFLDFPPITHNEKALNELTTSRFLQRMELSKVGYAAKTILDPRRCIVIQNHNCLEWLPQEEWTLGLSRPVLFVHNRVAVLHHYKLCHFKDCDNSIQSDKTVQDAHMLNYAPQLAHNVRVHLRAVTPSDLLSAAGDLGDFDPPEKIAAAIWHPAKRLTTPRSPALKPPASQTPAPQPPRPETPGHKPSGLKTSLLKTPVPQAPGLKPPGAKTPALKPPGPKNPTPAPPPPKTPALRTSKPTTVNPFLHFKRIFQ